MEVQLPYLTECCATYQLWCKWTMQWPWTELVAGRQYCYKVTWPPSPSCANDVPTGVSDIQSGRCFTSSFLTWRSLSRGLNLPSSCDMAKTAGGMQANWPQVQAKGAISHCWPTPHKSFSQVPTGTGRGHATAPTWTWAKCRLNSHDLIIQNRHQNIGGGTEHVRSMRTINHSHQWGKGSPCSLPEGCSPVWCAWVCL